MHDHAVVISLILLNADCCKRLCGYRKVANFYGVQYFSFFTRVKPKMLCVQSTLPSLKVSLYTAITNRNEAVKEVTLSWPKARGLSETKR